MEKHTAKEFNEMFPVCQATHSGLWGWKRVNGCIDLGKCDHASQHSAEVDRAKSNERALFIRTGDLCISK